MNLLRLINKAFVNRGESTSPSIHELARRNSFFLNESDYQFFLKYGFVIAKNLVKDEELHAFKNSLKLVENEKDVVLDSKFLNTGCLPNSNIRNITQQVIEKYEPGIFSRFFDMNEIEEVTGGSFVLKPAHPDSELGLHQDGSFVDEEKIYSLFAWIPLDDVTIEDGPVSVIPGSHLWGNSQRGFGVPWVFSKHVDLLSKYLIPITLSKGDVLFFDPALIHSSSPNYSKRQRDALTISVSPKNPELVYYFKEDYQQPFLRKYKVNHDFFKEYDFISKPDEKWESEIVPHNCYEINEEELKKLLEKYYVKYDTI